VLGAWFGAFETRGRLVQFHNFNSTIQNEYVLGFDARMIEPFKKYCTRANQPRVQQAEQHKQSAGRSLSTRAVSGEPKDLPPVSRCFISI
jgi:hypothetical protein